MPPQHGGNSLWRATEQGLKLLRRMIRCSFLSPSAPTAEQLAVLADTQLFKAIILNPYHVLKSRLLEKCSTNYRLRPRAHQFNLPQKDHKNLLTRLFLQNIY